MRKCLVKKLGEIVNNATLPILRETISIREIGSYVFSVRTSKCTFIDGVLTPESTQNPALNRLYIDANYRVEGKKLKFIFVPLTNEGVALLTAFISSGFGPTLWKASENLGISPAPQGTVCNYTYEVDTKNLSFAWTTGYPKSVKIEIYVYDVTDLTDEQINNTDWNDERFRQAGVETFIYK